MRRRLVRSRSSPSLVVALAVAAAVVATPVVAARALGAQGPPPDSTPAGAHHATGPASAAPRIVGAVGASAIGLVTRASPAFDGRALTEGYLSQPVLMGHLVLPRAGPRFTGATFTGTLNLEGLTLARGELNAGVYGEGYVDRRHPHTLVHEAMASVGGGDGRFARPAWSASAGRGFVPFGSDDPMARPLVKFPVNHHLAQVLERLVAIAGVRAGPLLVEAAAFNGDEPTGPYAAPAVHRFGDSWAGRVTVLPAAGVELSASAADLRSPEYRPGTGVDHRKWHAALRVERGTAGDDGRWLLAEVARTDDVIGGRRSHRFHSHLVEGAADRGPWRLALRLERTDRPEEERRVDPFRTVPAAGPHVIIGVTRWDGATAAVSRRVGADGPFALRPFVEVARLRATERVPGSLFQPAAFYGSAAQWSLSAGLRVRWGVEHGRMGRYGVAAASSRVHRSHDAPPAGGAHHHDASAPTAPIAP